METLTNALRAFLKVIWKFLCAMLVIIVVFMTLVMSAQIALRVMGLPALRWTEEVLRYSYVWIVFLGVPVVIYSNELTRFDLIQEKLSPLANKILETFLIAIMLLIFFFLAQGAFTMIRLQMRQMMTSLNIPMGIIYLSLPICALSSMLFLTVKVFLLWTGQKDLHEAAEKISGQGAVKE